MTNTETKCPIDRELATKHLGYLGYKPGEKVYLRFFYHSLDPRKNGDKGRKLNYLDWQQIEQHQADGRGVYVVVNGADGGGHIDADINHCCAIFCEWDDIPLAEQFEKWSELGFVEPTFTVYSGDKSMQPYWVFEEPIAPEQWQELQTLLITVMRADKSNKNPSRVFRLVGGWHVKPDPSDLTKLISAKTEIVGESGNRYSYDDLRDRLLNLMPTPALNITTKAEHLKYKEITVPVPIAVPITSALGKAEEFLSGVTAQRNTSMATLARDLIGVQSEFQHLGQQTNEDAYALFIDACRRCSPGGGWGEGEWEQIWQSAMKSSPIASISHHITDGVENCIRGEYWRYLKAQKNQAEISPGLEGEKISATLVNKALESDDKLIQDYNNLARFFGNRIRLNKLSKRIEINGQPVSIDRAKIQLAVRHGILLKSCKEDVLDIITELAEQNQYSPIEQYLTSLPIPADTSILDNLAEKYFGVSSAIYQIFVRKMLIGAVARALSPGCKLDTALILQGKQGFKKSTFFKVLAGDYFDDSLGAVSDKDERLKLHRAWFVEWSELESIFKRRDVSNTKAFLSSSIDAVRPPYCRDTQDFPRASIIVATTNKDEFLSDETGNRRFWIIPVQKRIDIKLLAKERDAIWAAAHAAYKAGETWWLEYDEELTAETIAQEFQTTDPWLEPIVNYTEHRDWVLLGDLLNHLQVDLSRQERAHQMRVTGILKILGWSKNYRTIGGKRCRVWTRGCSEQPPELEKNNQNPEVCSEDVQAESIAVKGVENQAQQVDHLELPLTPKKVIFSKTDNGVAITDAGVTENSESFGDFSVQVDRGLETLPPRESECALPQFFEVDPLAQSSNMTDPTEPQITELIGFIRSVLSENDPVVARQIQAIVKEVCASGGVDRRAIWAALTPDEQTGFVAMLNTPLIAPEDAEILRDIALIWWDEYPQEHLINQLFSWQSPGSKYDRSILDQWLQSEDKLVRDRITQLFDFKNNSTTEKTP
jgi:predicted P-loop ATPase